MKYIYFAISLFFGSLITAHNVTVPPLLPLPELKQMAQNTEYAISVTKKKIAQLHEIEHILRPQYPQEFDAQIQRYNEMLQEQIKEQKRLQQEIEKLEKKNEGKNSKSLQNNG